MSNALDARTLFKAVADACVTAWNVTRVFPERPRTKVEPSMLPVAIAAWKAVSPKMGGQFCAVGAKASVQQDWAFDVTFVAPFPADPSASVAFEKADRASELIAILQAGAVFAQYGLLPLVSEIDPDAEGLDGVENAYAVRLRFTFSVVVDHH